MQLINSFIRNPREHLIVVCGRMSQPLDGVEARENLYPGSSKLASRRCCSLYLSKLESANHC